jgi:hypothetical protein
LRHPERVLLVVFVAAMILVAIVARQTNPASSLRDPRHSTLLTSPAGASALAEALAAFGTRVERRRHPLFGIAADARRDTSDVLLILDPYYAMPAEEAREVGEYVARGGRVVLAGTTGVERRFGVASIPVGNGRDEDSLVVASPPGIGGLPGARRIVGRGRPPAGERGGMLVPDRVDTLLLAANRRPVAARYRFPGGGIALVIADGDWVANRTLRHTDVGALLIPWILAEHPPVAIVDEYHQGFGRGGAIFAAAWAWLRSSPAGWAMLQVAFAGLVALFAAAVRFGPALHVIERHRRSPVEHLDALAAGLERAGEHRTAVDLLGRGLRRRLQRAGQPVRPGGATREWLAALARATDRPAARRAVTRLASLLRESTSTDEHVLQTAQAVEDVWEALRQPTAHTRS